MGEIQLKNWAMRPSVGGVRVDGLRVDDASGIYWHSSSIVKRINNRLLETSSGSRYRLLGDLDENYAKEVSGCLCNLSSQFKRGFPRKWKYLIESAARTQKVKSDGDKQRKFSETFQAMDHKIPMRQNTTDGKSSYEMLKSVSFIGCHTSNRRAVRCNKRISKETPVSQLYSVTRSMTKKKLEQTKTRITSYGDGRHLDDPSFDGTILALTRGNFPLGRPVRKRKHLSGFETAAKKRKVKGRSVGRGVRPDCFPTPELQNNDIVFDSFSSQRTSVRNRRRMMTSTVIEPDILTLEGLLSPPEDAIKMMDSSQRTIIMNPVMMPLDLDEELEDDILQKSFLDADVSERRSKRRSRTVQPKQHKATIKQRKSSSLAPSKSRNVRSDTRCPVQTVRSVCGEHNLRPRTVKKDVMREAKAELRRKQKRLESKCDLKKHQLNENVNDCLNDRQLGNDAVLRSKSNQKAVTAKSSFAKGSTKQRLKNCDQEQSCSYSAGKVKLASKKNSQNCARPTSVRRVKCVEIELCSLSTEQIIGFRNEKTVKPVTQSKILAASGSEPSIAERSVVAEEMNAIQQNDGAAGQRLMEECPNTAEHSVHSSLMTMEVKQISTAEICRPKKPREKEVSDDVKTSALKKKKKRKYVFDRKITSVAQKVDADEHCDRTSVRNPQQSPQIIIKLPERHCVTCLDSEPVEERESRNNATVSALAEKGEMMESEKTADIIRRNDTDLKSRDRQVTETLQSFRKMQENFGRSVSQNELKIKNKTRQTISPNVVTTDMNDGNLKRISDIPVMTSTPIAKITVVKKKKTGGKKEIDGAKVTKTNEIENGQRNLSTQKLREQLEKKISKTKVIPLLPADSVEVEGDVVEECCLARCAEENVAVDINVIPPKQKKKSRKVAEVTGSVINVMNQMQKNQPNSDKEQKVQMKAPEKNDSILTKKNDQITNVKLLGGRGTLKRQKELRKLVEANIHCEANNDFFSSTPFQSPRARRFVFPKFDDDDDIFAGVDLGGALNYDMTDVTPHGFFRVMDYTANKTPASTTSTSTTPAGFKRRRSEQEAYNHRVKKILHLGQRKGRTSRKVSTKKPKANYEPAAGAAWKPALSLDKDLFEVKEVQEKDSEEEDFYFADD